MSDRNERNVLAIQGYINDLFEPGRNWPKYEFRKRSYARWAAHEVLSRVQRQPARSSIDVVREFAEKTEDYARMDRLEKDDSLIFYVAHDVAIDILDILRAMDE